MSITVIPAMDRRPWPTLGPQVCDLIEDRLVFGPGDLRGEPARLSREKRAVIYRAFEVHPYPGWPSRPPPRDDSRAGRRRFSRVALYWRKGKAKTELAAWLMACELHPESPVRCDGWRKVGGTWEPVGRPIPDPYIPMLAYTEEQTEELGYGALYAILSDSPDADLFDIGLDRIVRSDGTGRAVALSASPGAREGARMTAAHIDEPHLMVRDRHKKAHATIVANLPKRIESDAWMLETGTMFIPGEESVAESTWDAAHAVVGTPAESRSSLLLVYRGADERHDIGTDDGLRAAIADATGTEDMEWTNTEAIISQFRSPDADLPHLRKVWLNQQWRASDQAFDAVAWKDLVDLSHVVPARAWIVLGFDGSRHQDATALIATEVATGYQWPIGIWERPANAQEWEVPEAEVDAALDDAFRRWTVWLLEGDPAYWENAMARWQGRYRADRVKPFPTNRDRPMAEAVRAYAGAIARGELRHSGDGRFTAHIGNARRLPIASRDELGNHLFLIRKERPSSPRKIDAASAGTLSWHARGLALKSGIGRHSATPERAKAVFH